MGLGVLLVIVATLLSLILPVNEQELAQKDSIDIQPAGC